MAIYAHCDRNSDGRLWVRLCLCVRWDSISCNYVNSSFSHYWHFNMNRIRSVAMLYAIFDTKHQLKLPFHRVFSMKKKPDVSGFQLEAYIFSTSTFIPIICFLQRHCQIHLSQAIEYRWVAQIKHKNSLVLHANGITSSRNAADDDKRQNRSKYNNKTTFSECIFSI